MNYNYIHENGCGKQSTDIILCMCDVYIIQRGVAVGVAKRAVTYPLDPQSVS